MDTIRNSIKKILPSRIFTWLQPYYHWLLSFVGSIVYRHPSKDIVVIGITGTKGKSSTTEILTQILRGGGLKTASLSTIQFSIDGQTERNLYKMTMPGRFFVQKFLREAVDAGCTHAVVEMTSEGAKQHRHKFIEIDALIFTNLTPEHIESHGSFENYKQAKLSIAQAVEDSNKKNRFLVSNIDDEHGQDFLNFSVENKIPYSLNDLELYSLHKDSFSLVIDGTTIRVPLVGIFNVYNVLASIKTALAYGVTMESIQKSLGDLETIKGRVEKFSSDKTAGKQITTVVDYAHTPDSLTKLYEAFPNETKICVLGNTGGGRDTWKRPEMAGIAEQYCERIIFTNEDPYDENPAKIIDDMLNGVENKEKVEIIMDRESAIRKAAEICPDGGLVLVSGKGTDPYIMGPNGTKQPWSDAEVVQKVLAEIK
jgi:UDP-N-acetylmuramoyl-L-alanyl-D-glutamate--2,6-diaminopimelate ligase